MYKWGVDFAARLPAKKVEKFAASAKYCIKLGYCFPCQWKAIEIKFSFMINNVFLTLFNQSLASFNNGKHSNTASIRFITSIQNSSWSDMKLLRQKNRSLVSLSAGTAWDRCLAQHREAYCRVNVRFLCFLSLSSDTSESKTNDDSRPHMLKCRISMMEKH